MRPTSIFFPLSCASAPWWLGRARTPMFDAGAWAVALTGATWSRYGFHLADVDPRDLVRVTSAAVAVVWTAGTVTHLYLGRHPIERDRCPVHPKIVHLQVPPLALRSALGRSARLGNAAATAELVEHSEIIAPCASGLAEMAGVQAVAASRSGKDVEHR
jgi:hypothetical protein